MKRKLRFSKSIRHARFALLLALLVGTCLPALADDFYTYTKITDGGYYSVGLRKNFKEQLNKASGGTFTGKTWDGKSLTWNTGDALPNFNQNYSKVSLAGLFMGCSAMTSVDLSNFTTANVINMDNMFGGCSALTSIDVSKFNTANVTDMGSMFNGCSSLKEIDLSSFDPSSVTDVSSMFYGCTSLTEIDLSSLSSSKLTNMMGLFANCSSLTNINFGGLTTAGVTYMQYMFAGCTHLKSLNLNNFTVTAKTDITGMFSGLTDATQVTCANETGVFGWAKDKTTADLLNSSATGIQTDHLTFLLPIDETHFPDANFRSFVQGYDTEDDDYLVGGEVSPVTKMDVSGKDIYSLEGVKYFTNLTTLNCASNHIVGLDLSNNTKLTSFTGDGQTRSAELSLDDDNKVYFDIASTDYSKLTATTSGFTTADNSGAARVITTDAVTKRTLYATPIAYSYATGLTDMNVTGSVTVAAYVLPVSTDYVTLCLPWNAAKPSGVTAYVVTSRDDASKYVHMDEYTGDVLPASTGLMVSGKGTYIFNSSSSDATAPVTNLLHGVTSDYTVDAKSVMTLGHLKGSTTLGFYTYTGTTVKANTAYLDLPAATTSSSAAYSLFVNNPTGIHSVTTADSDDTTAPWYDLQGRKYTSQPARRGIYIHQGRKVAVK